jgi:hypothetical protein
MVESNLVRHFIQTMRGSHPCQWALPNSPDCAGIAAPKVEHRRIFPSLAPAVILSLK